MRATRNNATTVKSVSSTSQIEAVLGFVDEPELIHRDNLVLL